MQNRFVQELCDGIGDKNHKICIAEIEFTVWGPEFPEQTRWVWTISWNMLLCFLQGMVSW